MTPMNTEPSLAEQVFAAALEFADAGERRAYLDRVGTGAPLQNAPVAGIATVNGRHGYFDSPCAFGQV